MTLFKKKKKIYKLVKYFILTCTYAPAQYHHHILKPPYNLWQLIKFEKKKNFFNVFHFLISHKMDKPCWTSSSYQNKIYWCSQRNRVFHWTDIFFYFVYIQNKILLLFFNASLTPIQPFILHYTNKFISIFFIFFLFFLFSDSIIFSLFILNINII